MLNFLLGLLAFYRLVVQCWRVLVDPLLWQLECCCVPRIPSCSVFLPVVGTCILVTELL